MDLHDMMKKHVPTICHQVKTLKRESNAAAFPLSKSRTKYLTMKKWKEVYFAKTTLERQKYRTCLKGLTGYALKTTPMIMELEYKLITLS